METYSDRQPLLGEKGAPMALPVSVVVVPTPRRKRRVPVHGILLTTLAMLILLHLSSRSFRHVISRPVQETYSSISGPLELPGPSCRAWGVAVDGKWSYPLDFGPDRSFSVRQNTTLDHSHRAAVDGHHSRRVHIFGAVVVRPADEDHAAGAAEIETLANDERIGVQVVSGAEQSRDQTLRVQIDDHVWLDAGEREGEETFGLPCIVARITVWVPTSDEAAVLDSLNVFTEQLDVELTEGLALTVQKAALVLTVSGHIGAAATLPDAQKTFWLDAPKLMARTVSGDIKGPWGLRQALQLSTVSGNVDVTVEERTAPPPEEPGNLPSLHIDTVSGDIKLAETPSAAKVPGHSLALNTKSGDINARAVFAGSGRVSTLSGDQKLVLQPLAPASPDASDAAKSKVILDASSTSGSVKVELAAPDDAVIDFLDSHYDSLSGSIKLHYPASWKGHIRLDTVASGKVTLLGKGIRVFPDNRPRWPRIGHHIEGSKDVAPGEEASNVTAQTMSGSIWLEFS